MEGDSKKLSSFSFDISISIHALRVEGDQALRRSTDAWRISIHALRVEGDTIDLFPDVLSAISIHALRVEGDAGYCIS